MKKLLYTLIVLWVIALLTSLPVKYFALQTANIEGFNFIARLLFPIILIFSYITFNLLYLKKTNLKRSILFLLFAFCLILTLVIDVIQIVPKISIFITPNPGFPDLFYFPMLFFTFTIGFLLPLAQLLVISKFSYNATKNIRR